MKFILEFLSRVRLIHALPLYIKLLQTLILTSIAKKQVRLSLKRYSCKEFIETTLSEKIFDVMFIWIYNGQ